MRKHPDLGRRTKRVCGIFPGEGDTSKSTGSPAVFTGVLAGVCCEHGGRDTRGVKKVSEEAAAEGSGGVGADTESVEVACGILSVSGAVAASVSNSESGSRAVQASEGVSPPVPRLGKSGACDASLRDVSTRKQRLSAPKPPYL